MEASISAGRTCADKGEGDADASPLGLVGEARVLDRRWLARADDACVRFAKLGMLCELGLGLLGSGS